MAVWGYLAKLKRGLGLAFDAHFPHDFSKKCSAFSTLSMNKSCNDTPYFFLKISNIMWY